MKNSLILLISHVTAMRRAGGTLRKVFSSASREAHSAFPDSTSKENAEANSLNAFKRGKLQLGEHTRLFNPESFVRNAKEHKTSNKKLINLSESSQTVNKKEKVGESRILREYKKALASSNLPVKDTQIQTDIANESVKSAESHSEHAEEQKSKKEPEHDVNVDENIELPDETEKDLIDSENEHSNQLNPTGTKQLVQMPFEKSKKQRKVNQLMLFGLLMIFIFLLYKVNS